MWRIILANLEIIGGKKFNALFCCHVAIENKRDEKYCNLGTNFCRSNH